MKPNPLQPLADAFRDDPMTGCPDCLFPAVITNRVDLESTSGPVPHVTVQCVFGHLNGLMPLSMLREILDDAC